MVSSFLSYFHFPDMLSISKCGYDHSQRGYKERKTSTEFTGCLAHIEVTFVVSTERVSKAGLQQQAGHRALFELENAVSKIADLSFFLQSSLQSDNLALAKRLRDQLFSPADQVDQAILAAESTTATSDIPVSTAPSSPAKVGP